MSKSAQTSPRGPPAGPSSDKNCCGISESVMEARKRKPQPWVVRKLWILITLGIMGYSGYVYIARLCLPMIERKWLALGSQTAGILLLIFFSILYLWKIWAYFTVVLTAPGYARDHVARTERPPVSDFSASAYYSHSYQQDAPPTTETAKSDSIKGQKPSFSEKMSQTRGSIHPQDGDSAAGPSFQQMLRSDSTSSYLLQANEHNAGVLDSIVQPPLSTDNKPNTLSEPLEAGVTRQNQPTTTPVAQSRREARMARRLSKEVARNTRLDELNVFRKPSSTPILQPVFRYCDTDELVRPYRAHHCRACGTCVLRYDHHCPWIGQCVGARNHKFFLNFCFATSIFTAYVFASDLFFVIKSMRMSEGYKLDPHLIVLLALASLFWLFTTGLSVSHVRLIAHGQTTVESMQIKGMQEKEEQTLARGFGWWECSAKRKRKKTFDEEWGAINTEGNIWWRGSAYKEWMDVMGENRLGWIFPIGRGLNDGLSYPINPRFDSDGRLRKRSDWPEDLRR